MLHTDRSKLTINISNIKVRRPNIIFTLKIDLQDDGLHFKYFEFSPFVC